VANRPQLTRAAGKWYLVYELHLTNFFTLPVDIGEVSILPEAFHGKALRKYSGESLEKNLKTIGTPVDSVPRSRIEPGRRAVLFIWAPVASPESAPDVIHHRVSAMMSASPDSQIVVGAVSRISMRKPVEIDAPVRGPGWLSFYGACPDNVPDHDRLAYPRAGIMRFPQRFAVDWVQFGPDGRVFRGDSSRNENYTAYRKPVYAVSDGIVRSVINDVEENIPPRVTVRLTRHSVAGNVVILDIGDGRFAVYGHLRPGSILVKEGQRVVRGTQIAEVGNSGNSTGAHLHFHIIDAPSTGAGEGLAFMYRRYSLISEDPIRESILDEGTVWRAAPWVAQMRTLELPTCGSVLTIPE
jgi:hypothetical protein